MIMSMSKGLAEKMCILNNCVQRNLNNKPTGEFQNRTEPTW
jgi:hypothetical protein